VRVAEKVSRNIDILRRELTGKLRAPYALREAYFQERLTFSRSEMTRLITDEEMAWVEYSRLAEHPAIKPSELARSTVLGIADDEKRHAQQLKDIATLLERERKFESSSSFYVKYIDLTTGETVEKTIPDVEQYELYNLQREGKISIIDIHKVE